MRSFRKFMLAFTAMVAVAVPASAGMQIVGGLGAEASTGNGNDFEDELNDASLNITGLVLNRVYSLGADVKFTTAGIVKFYYHGSESAYDNSFEEFGTPLQSELSGNDAWVQAGYGGAFHTFSVAAGQTLSGLGFGFNGSSPAVASLAGTAGFGVFYNFSLGGNGVDYSRLMFGYDDNGGGPDDNHDDMMVSAEFISAGGLSDVPEPASIAMWGIGALGLVFVGRRRRQMKLAA